MNLISITDLGIRIIVRFIVLLSTFNHIILICQELLIPNYLAGRIFYNIASPEKRFKPKATYCSGRTEKKIPVFSTLSFCLVAVYLASTCANPMCFLSLSSL